MGKLFSLKEWLTVLETARHLSIAFGEEVTEADVLRLCLDGRLQLSVNFVNHAKARCGPIVPRELARTYDFPVDLNAAMDAKTPNEYRGGYMQLPVGITLMSGEVIELEDKVVTLAGVHDLPMIGGERLDVEHEYQMLTNGPAVTLSNLEGAFVERSDGTMCQLQESFDDNEYQAGSNAHLGQLKLRIARDGIAQDEAKMLLDRHAQQRKKFLESQRTKEPKNRYYPAGGLPNDAVLVVRTEALREFERQLATGQNGPSVEEVGGKERTTFLNIIGGLIGLMLAPSPLGKTRSGYSDQAAVIDGLLAHYPGAPGLSKRNLEGKFAEARRSLDRS